MGVGGDVLDAATFGDDNAFVRADDEQFDFSLGGAEAIVVRGGGGESGLGVGDEAEIDAVGLEGGFEDEADFLDGARRDVEAVSPETEGEFAGGGLPLFAVGGGDEFRSGGEGGCVVFGGRQRGDDLAVFDRATELVEIEVIGVDGGEFCCNLRDVRCAKHGCEFSE